MLQTMIQIGNSAGIILPKDVREEMGFGIGDKILLEKKNNKIILSSAKKKSSVGVNAKFMKMVDDFSTEHKDVLEELANK